ncbi:MAG: DUF3800 domain-containing protein [Acholeplasmataceae bacterium]
MNLFSIDESGSMTTVHCKNGKNGYFVIAIVQVLNNEALKKRFKRVISKNLDLLRECDLHNKMFDASGKFIELKSNLLSPNLKKKIALYLSEPNYFKVFYIVVNNNLIEPKLYKNTALAFNYFLGLGIKFFCDGGSIPIEDTIFHIDERNTKTETKKSLEEYLTIKLNIESDSLKDIDVEYFQSHMNKNIQIADLFSNIMFSSIHSDKYDDFIQLLKSQNSIYNTEFKFPYKK